MAGSHRASRKPPAVIAWGLVVLVVAALAGGLWLGTDGSGDDAPATGATPTATGSIEPTATSTPGTPSPTPSATKSPRPSRTTTPLTRVPADTPRQITAVGLIDTGFDESIEPLGRIFSARSNAEVARWGSRGEPGSPGSDTVYVVGRVLPAEPSAFGALPKLKEGDRITIRTDSGRITYRVTDTGRQPSTSLTTDRALIAKSPGRLVLIGLLYSRTGERTGVDLIVTAEILRATRG